MEYTRGEWEVEDRKNFDGVKYVGIEQLDTSTFPYIINMIAPPFVLGRAGAVVTADPLDSDKAIANAHLIAAAPELCEACLDGWEMLAYWIVNFEDADHMELCNHTREKIATIKQALAKAEGK